jgi:hypothetical protein
VGPGGLVDRLRLTEPPPEQHPEGISQLNLGLPAVRQREFNRPCTLVRTAALPDADFDAAALLHIAAPAPAGQLAIDVDHLSGRKRKDREFLKPLVLVQDLHYGQGTGEAQTGIVRSATSNRCAEG